MSKLPVSIPKSPVLKPVEDFYRLRREGIGFLEQMGSQRWTDYNPHDPGITILDALCYALTDLGYRTGWHIRDLLAPPSKKKDSFFTAREILTVNPWTPDDFRRLLIDLDMVRNAWVFCKTCACDLNYYGWCEDDELRLSYKKPLQSYLTPKKVDPLGLYEILLELEADPELGDLNDRKIEHTFSVFDADGKPHPVIMELRFPEWRLENDDNWQLFLKSSDAFTGKNGASFNLKPKLGAAKAYDVLTDPLLTADGKNKYIRDHWRTIFYVSFEIELLPGGQKITIENATLRMFGDTLVKDQTTAASLAALLSDKTPRSFIQRYRNKLIKVKAAVDGAKVTLHQHRNLDEDYCRVKGVDVEDVATCADVEVAPDADIERVQARIWFEIEQYFNPPVRFYTLSELMEAGAPVEDIFNGPALDNGFLKAEELEAAGLKTVLRTSDIINRLMDIPGVVAVNHLLLTKYDAEGQPMTGAADIGLDSFKPDKIGAEWTLAISNNHQPRLYHNLSRFLFYKNGLPFLPRMDEAYDTLIQLRGEAERPKIKNAPKDLPVPEGSFRSPEDYFPVQYSFPLTYGTGLEGLPSNASPLRRAQAKQMKAYLMPFEQQLVNALKQTANVGKLFALDPTIQRTYFTRLIDDDLIDGASQIFNGLTQSTLDGLAETDAEFLERRNRFLNHLMARFGEQFGEYALLLNNLQGQKIALTRLIPDKIAFLKDYPLISHDRARAFDYRNIPSCTPENVPGLRRRISRLLGFAGSKFKWGALIGPVFGLYGVPFQLVDEYGAVWLTDSPGPMPVIAGSALKVIPLAYARITASMIRPDAWQIAPVGTKFQVILNDLNGPTVFEIARNPKLYATEEEAQAAIGDLMLLTPRSWNDGERFVIVEHLLLRPKFPGDALFPACTDGPCKTCGDEDPYSFRLTFVMPGWTDPFSTNLDMRRFADRTIRQETPSHLLGKICWVGNDGFVENICDPVISQLTDLLMTKGLTQGGTRPGLDDACKCAEVIYTAFSAVFKDWYADKTLDYIHPDALQTALEAEFNAKLTAAGISCTTVLDAALWAEIEAIMVKYFHQTALYGWQFERFEDAWCKWLAANATIDWTEEHLQERVEAILAANMITAPASVKAPKEVLCKCATTILTTYGMDFYHWMETNLKAGNALKDFTVFSPAQISLCGGFSFKPGTVTAIEALLTTRYETYKEVSYRLWIVVNLLGKLRSTYPGATLHDCDDGSDQNPVRLDNTALGNYPLRRTLPPAPAAQPPVETDKSKKKLKPTKAQAAGKKPLKSNKPPEK